MLSNIWRWSSKAFVFIIVFSNLVGSVYSAERPDAGAVIGGLREQILESVKESSISVDEAMDQQAPNQNDSGARILVNDIRITGQKIYSVDRFRPIFNDNLGKELTLGQMEVVAKRISQYFHQRGYFLAKALIPAQTVKDGIMEIQPLGDNNTLAGRALNRSVEIRVQ
ncbi:MAG: hxuB 1 [Firmicutes bacterium]|nr:hxuB 1 [Bacillota bacterium]